MRNLNTIAYLAPEIPALSATFVYEEMLGLEKRGYRILSFSVRFPSHVATNQNDLASRTQYLYGPSKIRVILTGIYSIVQSRFRLSRALSWLIQDMSESGWLKLFTWKLVFQFLAGATLAKILIREKCDHLHVHFAHTPTQIAMYASALSGVPFTITAHANDIFQRGTLLRQKANRAELLLTISEHNLKYLEGIGIPANKLAVVRCGVSFSLNQQVRRHSISNSIRIGTLGRLVEKKGVDILLKAVRNLRDLGLSVTLDIAGDGPLLNQLIALARKLDIDDITSFSGSVSHEKVAAWLKTLDVFALACKMDRYGDMDGIPVVLMEAMSQEIPVVSTRLSGIPELVIDGCTGLLAQADDEMELAQKIMRIAKSPELAIFLAKNGAEYVMSEFGKDKNLDRLIAAFKTTAG